MNKDNRCDISTGFLLCYSACPEGISWFRAQDTKDGFVLLDRAISRRAKEEILFVVWGLCAGLVDSDLMDKLLYYVRLDIQAVKGCNKDVDDLIPGTDMSMDRAMSAYGSECVRLSYNVINDVARLYGLRRRGLCRGEFHSKEFHLGAMDYFVRVLIKV